MPQSPALAPLDCAAPPIILDGAASPEWCGKKWPHAPLGEGRAGDYFIPNATSAVVAAGIAFETDE
ncbi:MAG: hypothetical protein WD845_11490 [Pirellulales bacterium]